MKIPLIETTVAAIPITSTVVILDKINQKIYPENIPMIISMNKYPVPLPTSVLLNSYHHYYLRRNHPINKV